MNVLVGGAGPKENCKAAGGRRQVRGGSKERVKVLKRR